MASNVGIAHDPFSEQIYPPQIVLINYLSDYVASAFAA